MGGGVERSSAEPLHLLFPRRTVPCTVPNDLILTHTVHVTDDGVYIKKMSGGEKKRWRITENKTKLNLTRFRPAPDGEDAFQF